MCVRTSTAFYGNFILDMDRSPGFGSAWTDFFHRQVVRPIKTWFLFGSRPLVLNLASSRNSPDRSTKSTRLYLYSTSTACKHRVSGSLSLPSRGSFHLSFTVLCAIGHWVVFSLTGWSPLIPTRFHVSRGTLDTAMLFPFSLTGLSPSLAGLSRTVLLTVRGHFCSPNPNVHAHWFRLYPFRSPLLRISNIFFLFLRLLRCFSSPGSLHIPMDSVYGTWGLLMWVSPFRNLRVVGYLLLAAAYRSLSRLSSALSAKASTLRSYLLNLILSGENGIRLLVCIFPLIPYIALYVRYGFKCCVLSTINYFITKTDFCLLLQKIVWLPRMS